MTTKGDSLFQAVLDHFNPKNDRSAYHAWYTVDDNITPLAAAAEAALRDDLAASEAGSPAAIECLRKLALTAHYQSPEFAYQDKLPPNYDRAIAYIERAIAAQKKYAVSAELGHLYETAATIAKPHFYFGLMTEEAGAAEQRGQDYMEQAIAVYTQIGADALLLQALRTMGVRTLARHLQCVALAQKLEGDTSLALAYDIERLVNHVAFESPTVAAEPQLRAYIDLAHHILETHPLEPSDLQWHRAFLEDAGYYYHFQRGESQRALEYYDKAQALALEKGLDTYNTAFYKAAIYLEQQQYAEANAEYDRALKSTRLAVIDVEHAYFGKAMAAQLQGKQAEAIAIWRAHLVDKEIMNGISGYPGRFAQAFRPQLRTSALALIDAVGARNARRIVEEGWVE